MLPASNLSLIEAVSFVSLSLGDENRILFVGQYKVKENSALGRFRDTLSMTWRMAKKRAANIAQCPSAMHIAGIYRELMYSALFFL